MNIHAVLNVHWYKTGLSANLCGMSRLHLCVCGLLAVFSLVLSAAPVRALGPTDIMEFYQYDPTLPLDAEVKPDAEASPLHTVYHVVFTSVHNERVTALFGVPKKGKAPFPCMIVGHGYGDSKNFARMAMNMPAMHNLCVMGIDAQYHGERKKPGVNIFGPNLFENRNAIIQSVVDMRRAYDFLLTRQEVDPNRIGYLGASMGAIMGSLFLGSDRRPAAGVLIVGGGGWENIMKLSAIPPAIALRSRPEIALHTLVEHFQVVEPLNFIGNYKKPLLLLNGALDNIVPAPTGKALFEAASQPKEIVWYNSGHIPPLEKALPKVKSFLTKNLLNLPLGTPAPPAAAPVAVEKTALKTTLDLVNKEGAWPTLTLTAATTPPATSGVKVEVNVSGIGSVPMYDTGREGDVKAGDGIYTFRIELPIEVKMVQKADLTVSVKNDKGALLAEDKQSVSVGKLIFPKAPKYN